MTSIRRRTAALVAVSMAVLLLIGGVVLLIVLRRAMTAQFDDALVARASALQGLTRFDGTKVEMDYAGEAMPKFARSPAQRGDAEYFVAWVRDGQGWRPLERSESLKDDAWPPAASRDGPAGVRNVTLPGGGAGRAVLIEFSPASERDEEGDKGRAVATAALDAHAASSPAVRLLVALPRAPLDRTLAIVAWCIAGVGAALALASIAASRWAVSRGLAPLSDLSRRVEAIGPEALGTRFDAGHLPTELRPIAEQLSALLARLDEAFEREKRFSAAASHELRTPIAELRMLLEVAARQPRTSEQWSRTADTALGVLARAQALCETLLRLSRASAVRSGPDQHARTEVGPILAEQAARAIALHGGDARLVRIECDAGLHARIDAATLASILGNLIDNALRHGAATPEFAVRIAALAADGMIRIEVSNPAPDLDDQDYARLFEPFWRKDASRHDHNGFGLGLAVARTLARASGGVLAADQRESGVLCLRLGLPAAM
ncbi:MAG: ATP-binding protein [Phycisphaerales bacterium]